MSGHDDRCWHLTAEIERLQAREKALERENGELALYTSRLVCDFSTAEQAATEYLPRKRPYTKIRCRWCGDTAPFLMTIRHKERCPFLRPGRCVSISGHLWRLASDRERDGIIGAGGTWDLQYICQRKHCSRMEFCFYSEREQFEANNAIGEPWPPRSEWTPDFEREQWEAL